MWKRKGDVSIMVVDPCIDCAFKELGCKSTISQELYDDVFRLWDETFKRTKENDTPIIALERFQNKYEVR